MSGSLLRKIPSIFVAIFCIGFVYLEYSFVSTGIFSLWTLLLISFALVLSILAFGLSTEKGGAFFKSKTGLLRAYWPTVIFLLIAAVIVAYIGILSGGTDYTAYMSG